MTGRRTVDLAAYPDLVVIYLGMQANSLRGVGTLFKIGPQIKAACEPKPAGLLHCELNIMLSLIPLHLGMRLYWRDFESLETWTKSLPHLQWWKDFHKDAGGTGFWHETYFMRGGMEAIYLEMPESTGFGAFASSVNPQGGMFSARRRLGLHDDATPNEASPQD